MSLPNNALMLTAPTGVLLSPDALGRLSRVEDYEQGGVGLSDPSQGLRVQDWRLRLVGNEVRVSAPPYASETVLFTAAGITELSLAFDANMRPAVAYLQSGVAKLWWYDATGGGLTTTVLAADVRSPFLSFDDKRSPATTLNLNDILLFYVRSNRLCYRQQRERFQTERTLAWFEGSSVTIKKAGMNNGLRMQIEMTGMGSKLATGAVLSGWTAAAYLASVTSITGAMPADILATDLLYAVLMHRSAVTPPAGWTLTTSVACTEGATTQTLSVLKKTTPAPADSGANATFTQGSSGRMGLMFFAVRATSGTPNFIAATSASTNSTATNTMDAPSVTAAGTELVVMLATTQNATASVTSPMVQAGMSLISGQASQTRIGAAYQRRTVGQTNARRFTFDNGDPVSNGLAALSLRFNTI